MIARTLVLHLLKTIYVAFSITGLICSAQAKQPNVVFILVDDLGYMDIGANNPKTFYETPNVDALAASGVRFTNGYAANPVCSPTRYSIMTGKFRREPTLQTTFLAPGPESFCRLNFIIGWI